MPGMGGPPMGHLGGPQGGPAGPQAGMSIMDLMHMWDGGADTHAGPHGLDQQLEMMVRQKFQQPPAIGPPGFNRPNQAPSIKDLSKFSRPPPTLLRFCYSSGRISRSVQLLKVYLVGFEKPLDTFTCFLSHGMAHERLV